VNFLLQKIENSFFFLVYLLLHLLLGLLRLILLEGAKSLKFIGLVYEIPDEVSLRF